MGKRLTTYIFIEKSNNIHLHRYDYSLVDYKNNKTKVIIICKEHGNFEQLPINHINGRAGCPNCNGHIPTKEIFIEKSNKLHNNRYDYSKVIYKNSKTNVSIICEKHGVFKQTPNVHLSNHGCPNCGKMHTQLLLEKLYDIYKNKYDYSLVNYINNITPINIICEEHGIVSVNIDNFLYRKSGCKYCNGVYKDITYFIDDANKIHNYKYNYKIITNLYKNSYIEIICNTHGSFKQRICSHINNKVGCKKCDYDNRRKSLDILLNEFKNTLR